MKKSITEKNLCPLTLGLGLLGLLLRFWLYSTGIDKKGLLIASHPANILLWVITPLAMGLLIFAVTRCPKVLRKKFPASGVAAMGCFIAAAGILVANILELAESGDTVTQISSTVGVLAAVGLFYMGIRRKSGHRSSMAALTAVILYYMTHLVVQYRHWSAEPQLQHYLFPLLASVFLMLFAYHRSALDVTGKSFRLYIFFNQAALFFCCLSLNTDTWLFYAAMAVWTATDLHIPLPKKNVPAPKKLQLPQDVQNCMDTLTQAGYEAYVVGGCVRDMLLGKTPNDYDLCTNATPEKICQLFADYQLVRNGEKHGTIGVVMDKTVYEITTFRTEGGYSDSRHPDWVEFVPTIEEDLARRDFTVNAMAYNPKRGLVDPWGGQKDLKRHVLRTVGEPATRFTEDALRILRGVRFAVRYDLIPEPTTEKAMREMTGLMDNLAQERIFDEMCALLPTVNAQDLIRFAPVLMQVIPELAPCMGFEQYNPHHTYDVFTHTAHTVAAVGDALPLRWAALLHDIAKPSTFTKDDAGVGHFLGHAEQGAEMADQILQRLKAPNALRQQVAFLVEAHMLDLTPDKRVLRRRLSKFGTENIRYLLQLQIADCRSTGKDFGAEADLSKVQTLLEEIEQEDACLQIKDLAIDGTDLMALGMAPGPQMGQTLNTLLDKVMGDELPNEAQALLEEAKNHL